MVDLTPKRLPRSLAIAGAWGYIGRKFLDVAIANNLRVHVFDPGPMPVDVNPERIHRVATEAEFYALDAELFHLAVHPEQRREELLLNRPDPVWILNEKPMATPEDPERCNEIVAACDQSRSVMLYDFPELFDPLTQRVVDYLRSFQNVRLDTLTIQRSKDREDPANPRNYKRMVTIQYQESVHCLAYVLYVLAQAKGSVRAVVEQGVEIEAEASLYTPPNPEAYPGRVDGRCRYAMRLGGLEVSGLTDFTRGAPWVKRRILRGMGDGRPFEVDVSYLEGRKWLRINGIAEPCDPGASSYEQVLTTVTEWANTTPKEALYQGVYPHPAFARLTYQLSSALWHASQIRTPLHLANARMLDDFRTPHSL